LNKVYSLKSQHQGNKKVAIVTDGTFESKASFMQNVKQVCGNVLYVKVKGQLCRR